MKTSDKSFHQCYSGHTAVDESSQVMAACELTNETPDAGTRGRLR